MSEPFDGSRSVEGHVAWMAQSETLFDAIRGRSEHVVSEKLGDAVTALSPDDKRLIQVGIVTGATVALRTLAEAGWLADVPTVVSLDGTDIAEHAAQYRAIQEGRG